ncbi:hypothetical protein VCRA2119O147_30012 [Vibrio crassostreae]|uniref:Uncharacterized protein n=1 Tax=Vibrio crassostreae TaxID=246167 RepID=A0A4R3PG02_9VIBR|nr:hypothetical protein EDB56_11047 [Vibrio crassostreae]ROO53166.1 hypothetical protein EDB58_11184 [Vibrio crassostreae]ROO64036.1 hypothetical protein EDB64_4564 [Vibrio crassostreae]ROP02235.1 hypothetical protein EDB63_4327 [Vibrio crassostreae]ROQ70796.1 hypothetical protein EDB72_4448 [Vibrio crassostreae]
MHTFFTRITRVGITGVYMQNNFIDKNELKVEVCNVSIYIFNFEYEINYSLTI